MDNKTLHLHAGNSLFDYRYLNILLAQEIAKTLNAASLDSTLQNIASRFGIDLNIREIIVQSGQNNYWTTRIWSDGPKKGKPHLAPELAKKIYDEPAKESDYALGDDGNWHMKL